MTRVCVGGVLRGREARDAFTPAWDELARANPRATVFQSSGWYTAWIEAVAAHELAEPLVLRVPSAGPVRAAVALQINQEAPAVLRPLTWPWADYQEAVGNPFDDEAIAALAGALRELMVETQCRLVLDDVVPAGLLERIAGHAQVTRTESSHTASIDLTDSAHLNVILGHREHILKARRMARLGAVECRHHHEEGAVLKRMPAFVEMHGRRWSQRGDAVAPFDGGVIDAAFASMVRHMAPHGSLLLTELTLGGRPVAMYFGFANGRHYGGYRTAFDEELKRLSPGHLMLRQMILDFTNAGFHELDLMRGAYAYKDDYANHKGHNLRIEAY
jgi:CelD/BcsL family acetyltransferase involved in cellulose biosynthesis